MLIFLFTILASVAISYFIQRIAIKYFEEEIEDEGWEKHHMFFMLFIPYINLIASITILFDGIYCSWDDDMDERAGFFRFIDLFYGSKGKEKK